MAIYIIKTLEEITSHLRAQPTADIVIFDLHFLFTIPSDGYLVRGVGDFKLDGGMIQSPRHIAACLLCHGSPYIFDSSNYVAQTDWPKFKFKNYTKFINKPSSTIYVCMAVYVRQDAATMPATEQRTRKKTTVVTTNNTGHPGVDHLRSDRFSAAYTEFWCRPRVTLCANMVMRTTERPIAYFEARRVHALERGLPRLPTVDPRTQAIVEKIVATLAAFYGTTPDQLHVMNDNGQDNFVGAEVFTEMKVYRTFEANLTEWNSCSDTEFAFYTHPMAVYAFVAMATQLCPIDGSYIVANLAAVDEDVGRRTEATMHLMGRLGVDTSVVSREDARNIATECGVFGALGVAGVVRMVNAILHKDAS